MANFSICTGGAQKISKLVTIGTSGALMLALGILLAKRELPEWRPLKISEKAFYQSRFERLADNLGFSPMRENPRVQLLAWTRDLGRVFKFLNREAPEWIEKKQRAATLEVRQRVELTAKRGEPVEGHLTVNFSLEGKVLAVLWEESGSWLPLEGKLLELKPFLEILVQPGEKVDLYSSSEGTASYTAYMIRDAKPPEYILGETASGIVSAYRGIGSKQEIESDIAILNTALFRAIPYMVIFVATLGVALQLAFVSKRGILQLGFILSLICMVSSLLAMLGREPAPMPLMAHLAVSGFLSVTVFLMWVTVQSLLEGRHHQSTWGWAELVQKRSILTPRVSYELTAGFCYGLLLAGGSLLMGSLVVMVPDIYPTKHSIAIQDPILSVNPFREAVFLLGCVAIFQDISTRLHWALSGTVMATACLLALFSHWHPWYVGLILAFPIAAMLIDAIRTCGILGSLVASVVGVYAPLGIFAARYPAWLGTDLIVSGLVVAATVLASLLGLCLVKESGKLPSQRPNVFMSYAHEDEEFVKRLSADLTDLGAKVWLAVADMKPGESLVGSINTAIKESDYVLLNYSRAAAASKWVDREWYASIYREIRGKTMLIPLKLDDVEMPAIIAEKLYVSFIHPGTYHSSLHQLARGLGLDYVMDSAKEGANESGP